MSFSVCSDAYLAAIVNAGAMRKVEALSMKVKEVRRKMVTSYSVVLAYT